MADRLDDHPDFPAFFRRAREETWGSFAPRFERAVASGNFAAADRILSQVNDRSSREARRLLGIVGGLAREETGGTAAGPAGGAMLRLPVGDLTNLALQQARPPASDNTPPPVTLSPAEMARLRDPNPGSRFSAPLGTEPPPVPIEPPPPQAPWTPPPPAGLGPPTPAEFQAERERGAGELETGAQMLSLAAPMGPAFNLIGRGVGAAGRAIGGAMRAAPRTTGALGAGGIGMLGTGQADEPPPTTPELVEAQGRRGRAETARNEQQAAVSRLERELTRFAPDVGNRREGESVQEYRERIKELQRELGRATDAEGNPLYRSGRRDRGGRWMPGPEDGVWKGLTTAAAGARRAQLQKDLREARAELRRRGATYDREDAAVSSLIGTANYQSAERRMPWYGWLAREYGTPISIVGGALLGGGARALNSWRINAGNRAAAREADALVNPAAPLNERITGVGNFYERGGGTMPFRVDLNSPHGVVPHGNQTMGENLYRNRPGWLRQRVDPVDVGTTLTLGSVAGRAEVLVLPEARRELESAREAYRANSSPENAERLTRAEGSYATALVMARGGLGALGGYLGSSFRSRQFPRPDVNRAGQELLNINTMIRPPPPAVTWSSPAGPLRGRTVTLDPATGRFFDARGRTFPEAELRRKGWRPNQ
jgi:hypothetical protein